MTHDPDDLREIHELIAKLCELQMATMRQVATLQAEVKAVCLVSALVADRYPFEENEIPETLREEFEKSRRRLVQEVNDFLLAQGYIDELPATDDRLDGHPDGMPKKS